MTISMRMVGVSNAIAFITRKRLLIKNVGIPEGLIQGANELKKEVEASIAGQRAEKRSVDTGEFQGTIQIATSSTNTVAVMSPLSYPRHLEFGTSRIPARRHFRNSLDRKRKQIVDEVRQSIRKTI